MYEIKALKRPSKANDLKNSELLHKLNLLLTIESTDGATRSLFVLRNAKQKSSHSLHRNLNHALSSMSMLMFR